MEQHELSSNHFKFSSLGIWRKIYIFIIWLASTLFTAGAAIWLFFPEIMESELGFSNQALILLTAFILLNAIWSTWAISKRKTGHLIILTILQLFPLMNIVSTLIFFRIYQVSKDELAKGI